MGQALLARYMKQRMLENSLDEAVTSAATLFILLELNKLKVTERLEDILKILFCDREVDVADI